MLVTGLVQQSVKLKNRQQEQSIFTTRKLNTKAHQNHLTLDEATFTHFGQAAAVIRSLW